MRTPWLFILIFLVILFLVIAFGLGIGFLLRWIFPALELGAGFVAGVLAEVFSLYLTAKLVDAARLAHYAEDRLDEEVLKEYKKQSKVRRRP